MSPLLDRKYHGIWENVEKQTITFWGDLSTTYHDWGKRYASLGTNVRLVYSKKRIDLLISFSKEGKFFSEEISGYIIGSLPMALVPYYELLIQPGIVVKKDGRNCKIKFRYKRKLLDPYTGKPIDQKTETSSIEDSILDIRMSELE